MDMLTDQNLIDLVWERLYSSLRGEPAQRLASIEKAEVFLTELKARVSAKVTAPQEV